MKISAAKKQILPASVIYAITVADLPAFFENILSEGSLTVDFEHFENTSDVLIASSSFEGTDRLNEWYLSVISMQQTEAQVYRAKILNEVLPSLAHWFQRCDRALKDAPSDWICYSRTVRVVNERFEYDDRTAKRVATRPGPGWPQ